MMPYHQIGACRYHESAQLYLLGRWLLNKLLTPMDGYDYYVDLAVNLSDIA